MLHMTRITSFFREFQEDERGVTSIEYGILAAGVAVVVGALVSSDGAFATTLGKLFDSIVEQLPQKASGQ